jgi:hypothetical protein
LALAILGNKGDKKPQSSVLIFDLTFLTPEVAIPDIPRIYF